MGTKLPVFCLYCILFNARNDSFLDDWNSSTKLHSHNDDEYTKNARQKIILQKINQQMDRICFAEHSCIRTNILKWIAIAEKWCQAKCKRKDEPAGGKLRVYAVCVNTIFSLILSVFPCHFRPFVKIFCILCETASRNIHKGSLFFSRCFYNLSVWMESQIYARKKNIECKRNVKKKRKQHRKQLWAMDKDIVVTKMLNSTQQQERRNWKRRT